eukprot:jgi/Bigna1/140188/aug1.54_g14896
MGIRSSRSELLEGSRSLEGCNEITKQIWLGDCKAAKKIVLGNEDAYTLLGITHVLDVSDRIHYSPDEKLHKTKVLKVPMKDGGHTALDEKHLSTCFGFIEDSIKSGGKVLVHCHVGINRSASIVIAWLMKSKSWNLERTLKELRKKRSVYPYAYISKLAEYEKRLVNEGMTQSIIKNPMPKDKEADQILATICSKSCT